MELPPKAPQKRIWKDSEVAPFGGNNALVLHHCPSNNETKYFVQVLHNEQPMPMAVRFSFFHSFCILFIFKFLNSTIKSDFFFQSHGCVTLFGTMEWNHK